MNYSEIAEFSKDFKKLSKRHGTLVGDFKIMKKNAIELYHLRNIDNQSVFPVPGFCSESIKIYKVKKFACKSLPGRGCKSGLRVIYAHHPDRAEVVFIEIYFKSNQENESRERIKEYFKNENKS
jgi:hypothetical protein